MKAFYSILFDMYNIIKGIKHLKFSCHFYAHLLVVSMTCAV